MRVLIIYRKLKILLILTLTVKLTLTLSFPNLLLILWISNLSHLQIKDAFRAALRLGPIVHVHVMVLFQPFLLVVLKSLKTVVLPQLILKRLYFRYCRKVVDYHRFLVSTNINNYSKLSTSIHISILIFLISCTQ
jgi:hypothetical protein